jgi:hypothetical protein
MIWPRPDDNDNDDFDDFDLEFASRSLPHSQQRQWPRDCAGSPPAGPNMDCSTPPSAQHPDMDSLPLSHLKFSETTATNSSPAWSHGERVSPYIPSAQPYSYPFSLPPSGIRPLTPLSPLRGQVEDEYYRDGGPENSTSTSPTVYSDVPDELLETVIDGISRVQVG